MVLAETQFNQLEEEFLDENWENEPDDPFEGDYDDDGIEDDEELE